MRGHELMSLNGMDESAADPLAGRRDQRGNLQIILVIWLRFNFLESFEEDYLFIFGRSFCKVQDRFVRPFIYDANQSAFQPDQIYQCVYCSAQERYGFIPGLIHSNQVTYMSNHDRQKAIRACLLQK